MPHLPGVATASEIQRAVAHGLDWVKAFPAAALGESWFTLMRGPFPDLKVVATGGMSADNATRYLSAGASVVAVGSALGDPAQLDALTEMMRSGRAGARA
jgi:2-dehydro-3-deoxyphosphogluconate aldolase/(4S)-4-hydroxy-2-oxoglutarate aldolase